jgi:hypothetical protein
MSFYSNEYILIFYSAQRTSGAWQQGLQSAFQPPHEIHPLVQDGYNDRAASGQPDDEVMLAAVDVDAFLQSGERLRSRPPVTHGFATRFDLVEILLGLLYARLQSGLLVCVTPDVCHRLRGKLAKPRLLDPGP